MTRPVSMQHSHSAMRTGGPAGTFGQRRPGRLVRQGAGASPAQAACHPGRIQHPNRLRILGQGRMRTAGPELAIRRP